jgi:serine-threonine kinase receptor-associated protein
MFRQVPLLCSGHTRPITSLMYSSETPDGTFLISGGKDGKAMLRDAETGDWIGTFSGHQGAVYGTAINAGATMAVTGSADFSVMLWDCISGQCLRTLQHKHIVRSVAISSDSTKILTAGQEKIIRLFDLQNADAESVALNGHTGLIKTVLWSDDPNVVLSSSEDSTLRLWDLRTGQSEVQRQCPAQVTSMQLSWDAQTLISTSAQNSTVSFATVKDLTIFREYKRKQQVEAASLHPSQPLFVVGGDISNKDLWVRMVNYETGEDTDELKGHHGPVHCVQFAPNGQTYASGSEDGTVRIWRTSVAELLAERDKQQQGKGDAAPATPTTPTSATTPTSSKAGNS